MIYLITDQLPGEPDILKPVCQEVLYIRNLDGELLTEVHAISNSWTHQALVSVARSLSDDKVCQNGADAYLGTHWIGSTEC
jgi:hypothetical protein